MVSRIIIPDSIVAEIKNAGRREANRDKEDVGLIFGLYDEESNSIVSREIYHLLSKIGGYSLRERVYDYLKHIVGLPRYIYTKLKFNSYAKKLKRSGVTPALVPYHTHDNDSTWSESDMSVNLTIEGVSTASLLYRVGSDKFLAVDATNNEDIEVMMSD